MNQHFEFLNITHQNVLKLIEGLTVEQLNEKPAGFNNNLAWNLGHILVTQQLLVYKLSKLTPKVSAEVIDKYRKGSKPEANVDEEEISFLKNTISKLAAITEKDYNNNIFKEYTEYTTSYNANLKSVEDAIIFNNIHAGLHYGYMMAIKRMIS